MTIKFMSGHIIPRWCHVATTDRKAQHNCKFGCDVEVELVGGLIKISAIGCGPVLLVQNVTRKMKNGTRKKVGVNIANIHLTGCETGCKFTIDGDGC